MFPIRYRLSIQLGMAVLEAVRSDYRPTFKSLKVMPNKGGRSGSVHAHESDSKRRSDTVGGNSESLPPRSSAKGMGSTLCDFSSEGYSHEYLRCSR